MLNRAEGASAARARASETQPRDREMSCRHCFPRLGSVRRPSSSTRRPCRRRRRRHSRIGGRRRFAGLALTAAVSLARTSATNISFFFTKHEGDDAGDRRRRVRSERLRRPPSLLVAREMVDATRRLLSAAAIRTPGRLCPACARWGRAADWVVAHHPPTKSAGLERGKASGPLASS